MDLLDRISSGWKAWLILLAITMGAAAPGVFNLPALDRDESRFAQASKQMLETGDYIRIRYQDELRNKKPAGIHWLQAASTSVFSDAEAKQIWSYRIPSWIGAGLGTLMTFWAGLALMNRRAAFVGAALFGATILLTSEAHISKTDGMLVFLTTLGIGALARIYMADPARAAPGATDRMDGDRNTKTLALLFWGAMGLGFLIKGPVSIMIAGFAAAGVWAWDKAADNHTGNWWRSLAWWPGPALFLALWIPWFIWIQLATDGQYVQGAVGKDLADKFTGASEGHAGWPLYQLSHIPVWFFPATLALCPGAVVVWTTLNSDRLTGRRRGTDALLIAGALAGLAAVVAWVFGEQSLVGYPFALVLVFGALGFSRMWKERWPDAAKAPSDDARAMRFLIAWVGLTWIFFELMPTRLSHYVLPAYPALGLVCGLAITKLMDGRNMAVSRWIGIVLFALGGAIFAAVSFPGIDGLLMAEPAGDFTSVAPEMVLAQWEPLLVYPLHWWAAGIVALVLAVIAGAMRQMGWAASAGIVSAVFLGWHVRFDFIPSQTWIQPTVVAQNALVEVCGLPDMDGDCDAPAMIQAVGYSEPSYVMTTGTQNLHPPETVVSLPDDPADYPAVFLINLEHGTGPGALGALRDAGAAMPAVCLEESESHFVLNYSNGDPVHFIAVRFDICLADS
ncbi:MAG: glycosyltransferase family 39 protein [Pseudomonadota bacterium]